MRNGVHRVWGLHKGVRRGEGVCTGRVRGVHGAVQGGARGVVEMLWGYSEVLGDAQKSAVPSKSSAGSTHRDWGAGHSWWHSRDAPQHKAAIPFPPALSRLPKQSWAARAGSELKYLRDRHPLRAAGESLDAGTQILVHPKGSPLGAEHLDTSLSTGLVFTKGK